MRHFPSSAELSRRQFIQLGSLGLTGGLSLGRLSEAVAGLPQTSKQQSVVMIYLPGGPTQFETFDPKPDAPSEIRGSFAATQSRVPGVQFCELLPELSKIADKFSVVRTLVGMENRHESFQCYTGRAGGRTEDGEPAGGWPSFGSIVSQLLGPGRGGMIPYVDAAPKMSYNPYNNNGSHLQGNPSWPGFTGYKHVPFALEGEVKSDLILNGIDLNRFNERRVLLETVKQNQSRFTAEGIDDFQDQAFQMLSSGRFAAAMDLEQEPQSVRDRYGKLQKTDPSFGGAPQSPQHLLLARRLVEAGVRCVSVAFGAWDWHANREGSIEYLSRKYLPVFDHSLAVFLQDLEERGLLEQTTVIVWGEFGRTPRINAKGGRDHWPGTQSVLLAGGGIQGGRVVGQTDRVGGVPLDRPVHVQEIFATLYQNLGINIATAQITDLSGRPRYLIDDDKQPIPELY
ncbi:DUF1501 domain-containing protein [Gimesia maris]|uniref:DUF1501 domain-containing protein n=2 Tax=Gimesia maris TaxID=122 RepID=A0ABX5YNW9_9PLAN|nr:DUF1501 domain-containing protein [Gimesia maris]QEG17262.1 hypothetical protein GmarT_31410 [Gimesia maris]QGQ29641.1 DUF1501 domain-containing protein [Gimesia maris]|tara:strand:+ start:49815 stop:51179 length:1365 start_codon:yes stop_codon:yes gene_type:complete